MLAEAHLQGRCTLMARGGGSEAMLRGPATRPPGCTPLPVSLARLMARGDACGTVYVPLAPQELREKLVSIRCRQSKNVFESGLMLMSSSPNNGNILHAWQCRRRTFEEAAWPL